MNKGFQIEIQSDLNTRELDIAKEFADIFSEKTKANNMKFFLGGSGGWSSYLRRKCFGFTIKDSGLVFRRISNKKRIFGIIRESLLVVNNDKLECDSEREEILPNGADVPKMCMCPKHRGGIRVSWRNKKPETFIYLKEGIV